VANPFAFSADRADHEKAGVAERGIRLLRLGVVALNVASFPLVLGHRGVHLTLAWAVMAGAVAYVGATVLLRPHDRFQPLVTSYVTTALDAILIALWLAATGGLYSPYFTVCFLSLLAVMLRFDARRTFVTSAVYAAFYVAMLAAMGQVTGHEIEIAIQVGYLLFTGLLGGLVASELLHRIRMSVELEQQLRENAEIATALAYRAEHDELTGLPNRAHLVRYLEHAAECANVETGYPAVLYVDFNGFKGVNDTWGHDVGDAVLARAGQRLRAELRDADMVARVGGDEFAVVLTGVSGEQEAVQAAHRLRQAFALPFMVGGQRADISLSVGIACYPAHGLDAPTLMRHADLAMYEAKRQQRGVQVCSDAAFPRRERAFVALGPSEPLEIRP
jgi:diguanylate cyclase (GGDEF)-like protein